MGSSTDKIFNIRLEVMQTIEKSMGDLIDKYLKPIDTNWQPSDFLPDSTGPEFFEDIKEIQELAKELDDDFLAVLVGDTITEEALPTYESWLMNLEGVDKSKRTGWYRWISAWTAEENRHGDLLNKYLYLSGRINMKEVEISTQHLIADGFDIGTSHDPYKNFIYTSFQEIATNISHRRVASLAKKSGNARLAKMCGVIASDENRHANAYMDFVERIFTMDPSEVMLAFQHMMKIKIVMPAHFLRESGESIGSLFEQFSDAAQRLQVYTAQDYIDILQRLLTRWDIEHVTGLNDKAERARDYLMKLPNRLERISSRIHVPESGPKFKWIAG